MATKEIENEQMSIETLVCTLNNYNIMANQTELLNELLEYNNYHSTSETVIKYTAVLEDIITKVDESRLSKKNKNMVKTLITAYVTLLGTSQCDKIIIQEQSLQLNSLSTAIDNIQDEYQKERTEHNSLRKKYNEKLKTPKVENISAFMPTVDLSISLCDKNKVLKSKDIVALVNANSEKLKNNKYDKFVRISNKDENGNKINNNIKAVFAKPNDLNCNNIIKQK